MPTTNFEDKYQNYSPLDVCEMIGQKYQKHGNYCITACYNVNGHKNGDRKPSLAVYGYERGYYCFSCGESGSNSWLLKQFNARDDNYNPTIIARPNTPALPTESVSTDFYCQRLASVWSKLPRLPEMAITMLMQKGLDVHEIQEMETLNPLMGWRWHTDEVKGWGEGIFIPYVLDGRMVTARLRRLSATGARFLSMPGNTMYPYNADAMLTSKDVLVTEGETDCLTLNFEQALIPAVGIPGATSGTAIRRLIQRAVENQNRLIVIPDNDQAGTDFAKRIQLAGLEAKLAVDVIKVPKGKDINQFFNISTMDEQQRFLERLAPAMPRSTQTLRDFVGDIDTTNIQEATPELWNTLVRS